MKSVRVKETYKTKYLGEVISSEQVRTSMNFYIKSHFRQMHSDNICDGCQLYESTTRHTLKCQSLLGRNELVTYIPDYEDLFGDDEVEQAYIVRLIRSNLDRISY